MLSSRCLLVVAALSGIEARLQAQDSLNVRCLFHWDDPTIPVGIEWFDLTYMDVWGYAAGGHEYAFLSSTLGIHIFDVTEPAVSEQVAFVPAAFSGEGVGHRDMKTHAGYLYAVCDEGPSTLQVIDLHGLPNSVQVVYDSNELFARAHNIQVDTANARLYACGGDRNFTVISIANPAVPELLLDPEAEIFWWGSEIGYVHDCFVRDNIVWTNDGNGLHVVDFTDAGNPILLGSLMSYPQQGYNHSSWMNDAGTVLAMADETHGSPLKFVDASDVGDLEVLSTVTSGVDPTSILHNPFYTGDLVHVAYYYDGYWLWDTSDPLQPMLLGFYDTCTAPNADNYRGAWGTYPFLPSGHVLVSDMQTGLWVLDVTQATALIERSTIPDLRISPTITDGSIHVTSLTGTLQSMRVDVISTSGQVLLSTASNGACDIDLSGLGDGLYFVRASMGAKGHSQRIVKTSIR